MGKCDFERVLAVRQGCGVEVTGDQARAILIVAALWTGATNGASFVGGRMTAPVPPAEVRYVTLPAPAPVVVPEPAPVAPLELEPPAAPVAAEPEPVAPPEVEAKPLPKPRPKIDAKPKAQPKPKARPSALKKSLPSCDAVKREFDRMSWPERMAEYRKASAEEIAHGRRCLGM